MKKNFIRVVKVLVIFVFLISSGFTLSGCSKDALGYHIKTLPNKIVYQVGEEVELTGLKLETVNLDGTHTTVYFSKEDVNQIDTSSPGTKKVVVEKNNLSVSFNIYVANVVVNDNDNLKQAFENLNNGDIVYLRKGDYKPSNNEDKSYKDVVVNKSITIVGDGDDKTNFYGNFIVGANYDGNVFTKIENFENVTFQNIGFKLESTAKNGFLTYDGPYGKTDENGAIRTFDIKNLKILNCNFNGYAYALLAESVEGLTVTNCEFRNLKRHAIKITNSIQRASISHNAFMDIATNMVVFENEKQSVTGALYLSFSKNGECGVAVCNNVFVRIGMHTGDSVYYNDYSKTASNTSNADIFKKSFVNNSAVISLVSSAGDDLEVTGIVLGSNNYGENLQMLHLGTSGVNSVNQNSIISISS